MKETSSLISIIAGDDLFTDKTSSLDVTSMVILYGGCAIVLALVLIIGRSKSAAVKSARARLPVVFFGILTLFAGSYGIYDVVLCSHEIFARSLAAWKSFLGAEIAFLFAWRFLGLTALSLATSRDTVNGNQAQLRIGTSVRFLFLAAAAAAGLSYALFHSFHETPLWFVHVGHAVIAVLIFCAFTYPWRRGVRNQIA